MLAAKVKHLQQSTLDLLVQSTRLSLQYAFHTCQQKLCRYTLDLQSGHAGKSHDPTVNSRMFLRGKGTGAVAESDSAAASTITNLHYSSDLTQDDLQIIIPCGILGCLTAVLNHGQRCKRKQTRPELLNRHWRYLADLSMQRRPMRKL